MACYHPPQGRWYVEHRAGSSTLMMMSSRRGRPRCIPPLRGLGGSAVICKKDSRRSRAINITPFHEPSACLFPLAPGRARLALPFRRSRLSLPAVRTRSRSSLLRLRKDSLSCFRSWKNRGVHFLVSAVWDGTLYSRNHTRLWDFLSRLLPYLTRCREIECRVT